LKEGRIPIADIYQQQVDSITELAEQLKATQARLSEVENECVKETKRATEFWEQLKGKDFRITQLSAALSDPAIYSKDLRERETWLIAVKILLGGEQTLKEGD
jgi:hypothetical protein